MFFLSLSLSPSWVNAHALWQLKNTIFKAYLFLLWEREREEGGKTQAHRRPTQSSGSPQFNPPWVSASPDHPRCTGRQTQGLPVWVQYPPVVPPVFKKCIHQLVSPSLVECSKRIETLFSSFLCPDIWISDCLKTFPERWTMKWMQRLGNGGCTCRDDTVPICYSTGLWNTDMQRQSAEAGWNQTAIIAPRFLCFCFVLFFPAKGGGSYCGQL